MFIIDCSKFTVQWIFCFFKLKVWLLPAPPLLSSNQRPVFLLLNDLDDVLVLHDVWEADPLGAVLCAGSLEDQHTNQFRLLPLLGFKRFSYIMTR